MIQARKQNYYRVLAQEMPVFVNVVVDLLPSRCGHTARIYCTKVVTSLYDSTVVAVWYNFSTS